MTQGKSKKAAQRKAVLVNPPEEVAIPPFVELTEAGAALWPMFTRARAPGDWKELDLILLAKICNTEAEIREHKRTIAQVGAVIRNDRGTPISNPLNKVIDELQRQQCVLIRALSLTAQDRDPRNKARDLKERDTFAAALEHDPDGYLARPQPR